MLINITIGKKKTKNDKTSSTKWMGRKKVLAGWWLVSTIGW